MINSEPQTFKQEQDSNNNSRKLSVIEYSHLITLGLINVHDDYAEQFLLNTKTCLSNYIRLEINYDQLQRVIENFTRILRHLITSQITSLNIGIIKKIISNFSVENESNIFSLILSICKNLNDLTFKQCFSDENLTISIYNLSSASCVSSALTNLNIFVNTFDDCFYLLDGRLESLSILIIDILKVSYVPSNIDHKKKFPKLKCFSLKSYCRTFYYDSQIVPLLRRMLNLEELTLLLAVIRINLTDIDDIHLYDEILIHMPRLNKLMFSITNVMYNIQEKIDLPPNENIQHGFLERAIYQVGSYITKNSSKIRNECYTYSSLYPVDVFVYMTSSFSGGKFDAQRKKRYLLPFITFSHIVKLHLDLRHIDYVEQFLYERNAHLPRLLSLQIQYEILSILTNNFTNDSARVNCAKI
ncbi:unnamed protein product [Rotaria sp. Silwood2]|nr:unnamed protein product [Rotaria sp. Silwood2]